MTPSLPDFLARWRASGAEERANKDLFFTELCEVLGVPRPSPKTGDPARDVYVFEADVPVTHAGDATSVKKIDVYRAGHFLLEAKQAANAAAGEGRRKLNRAKRGSPAWEEAMKDAYGQALGYARMIDKPPPLLVVADLGHCFDLYACFDGSRNYAPFPMAQTSRLWFADLEKHRDTLRAVLTDPGSLDPSRRSAKVTREVAERLARLAHSLEEAKHAPEAVATFLMRCLFTMFAEDVGLLPEYPGTKQGAFTGALEHLWIASPKSFPAAIEGLWRAMNAGTEFGFMGKLLRFNGGLFASPAALPLDEKQLALLLEAAKCNWADVEPAIFGTLLERALDEKERHALGAHYTPRAYVERLVRPTIEEPLRADWELVQAEIRALVADAEDQNTGREAGDPRARAKADKARRAKLDAARAKARAFHQQLCATKVLDPACGSGNFLYVALDLFQRLEGEVLAKLEGLGETQQLLRADSLRVTPAQFLGIEKKRWAKEIAELVLWIGYLQHHVRAYGRATPPPEPVLQDYKNIECRDAVLAWDREELVRDDKGKPVTRWNGESTKKHPVTGAEVPDETKTVPVVRYVNPRKAEWPKADFIVGNPPFVGNKRMRAALGDGYVEALRSAYAELSSAIDYVMYWWADAARLVGSAGGARRFGFVSTSSITQGFNQSLVRDRLREGLGITFAIADHPWVDSSNGAAVRIAMCAASAGEHVGAAGIVAAEESVGDDALAVDLRFERGTIGPQLRAGAATAGVTTLAANAGICFTGMYPMGQGFIVSSDEAAEATGGSNAAMGRLRPYFTARDLVQKPRNALAIDLFPLSEGAVREQYPTLWQWLANRVKPQRDQERSPAMRDRWWLFARPRTELRRALGGLTRMILVPRTAKHFVFQSFGLDVVPDSTVVAIAMDDAKLLGLLSSRVHLAWATTVGGRLGIGNDPRYQHEKTFNQFPFPACTPAQAARIRDLGEQLDAHRKRQQAAHPGLTITGMYNVLEKLRAGEPLTAKEKLVHEQGLVSVLKQIHDDLDAAVFDAYGWPRDLTDEQILEKLVALNAERAEEEKNGLVRWLRPDFQNPGGAKATQAALPAAESEGEGESQGEGEGESAGEAGAGAAKGAGVAWPKELPDQVRVVRDLVARAGAAWTAKQAAARFKGVSDKGVVPVLDALAALGVVVAYERKGERVWQAARTG
jgi:hypothetical protein